MTVNDIFMMIGFAGHISKFVILTISIGLILFAIDPIFLIGWNWEKSLKLNTERLTSPNAIDRVPAKLFDAMLKNRPMVAGIGIFGLLVSVCEIALFR